MLPVEVRLHYLEFAGVGSFFAFAADVSARKAAEEASLGYQRRLRALAAELTTTEERQRRELAAVLHDDVGQTLFAATMQLAALREREADPDHQRREDGVLAMLDRVARETRELTFELCPPVLYQVGLDKALARLAEQFTARFGTPAALTGASAGPADLNLRGLVYHGVRELLNNVAKHAGATRADISLAEDAGGLTVTVADDGRGVDPCRLAPGKGGFGLFNLRERLDLIGGSLTVESAHGRGCRVTLRVPASPARAEPSAVFAHAPGRAAVPPDAVTRT
jgi:signal transduction histidine kinase